MANETEIPFGRNLTKLMRDRDLRIQDVSKLAGVGKSVVHSWMTGTTPRDLRAVKRLADALKIQFTVLLLNEVEKETVESDNLEFDGSTMFDGLCRIRIDRIRPVSKKA